MEKMYYFIICQGETNSMFFPRISPARKSVKTVEECQASCKSPTFFNISTYLLGQHKFRYPALDTLQRYTNWKLTKMLSAFHHYVKRQHPKLTSKF